MRRTCSHSLFQRRWQDWRLLLLMLLLRLWLLLLKLHQLRRAERRRYRQRRLLLLLLQSQLSQLLSQFRHSLLIHTLLGLKALQTFEQLLLGRLR